MGYFSLIVASTVALNLGLFGFGRWIRRDDPPAAAALRGWTIFLVYCATAWFFKFPAVYLGPGLLAMLGVGWFIALKTLPRALLFMTVLGSMVIAALLALPFLRYPHLLAYAHWGTDQWGYIQVAKWLLHHSVDALPVINDRPGLDWVWYVLTVKDRPLVYVCLAVISATFHCGTFIAYYIFPAALLSALFLALFLGDVPAGFTQRVVKALVCLGITIQPLVMLHYQYQFLGGTIAALAFMLLIAALFQVQVWRAGDPRFFAAAALFSVLLAGLYTIKISGVSLAILGVIFGFCLVQRIRHRDSFPGLLRLRPASLPLAFTVILIPVCFFRIRALMPEPWFTPMSHGQPGHIWAHFGSIFGITDILPWYQPDGAPAGLDPVRHYPAGSVLAVWLLGTLLVFFGWQSWRWLKLHKDITPAVVLGAFLLVGYLAAPPRGDHWRIGRSLPIYGGALLVATVSTALRRQHRAIGWFALGLACFPLVRAAPSLWPYFATPVNRMIDGAWDQPPEGNVWGALGYAYFYEDTRDIDWSKAPECFRAMTHYMPENLRPKMKRRP